MELKVLVSLVGTQYDRETGMPIICLSAKNLSELPTGRLELLFECDGGLPQPAVQEGEPQAIPGQEGSRRLAFDVIPQKNDGPLAPGQTRLYVFPKKWMQTLEGIITSLPPERYRLLISNNGERRPSISGPVFGDYVQQLLRFIVGSKKGRLRFRQKKYDCTVCLFRPDEGESPESTTPMVGVIHLVEVLLGQHPFWLGIIELPIQHENLLHTFIYYRCHVVLEDKRQGAAAIVRVFAKDDYMGMCVSGVSKLVVE